MTKTSWRRRAFLIVVVLALALAAFFGAVLVRPDVFLGLVGAQGGHISEHFRQPAHRTHDLTFSLLLGTGVVGIVAQLRGPSKNVAGQLMALIPFVGLALAAAVTNLWVFRCLG